LTPGFQLPAKFVIHAVGPVWRGGKAGEADLLASTYRAALRLATERALRSVAFPAISTGIYGYPLREATEVAIRTVRQVLEAGSSVDLVIFACFSPEVLQAYREAGVTA
jgi:O-acetyl-ADP-ribose deacetylase (regulator of RNase III)